MNLVGPMLRHKDCIILYTSTDTNWETALLVGADGPNPGGLSEGCNKD